MSSHFRLLQPYEFVHDFIAKGLHPDGRQLNEFRSTSLQTNLFTSADGSALVRHGNNVVTCSIKGELSEPDVKSAEFGGGRVVLSAEGQPHFSENKCHDLSKACTVIRSLLDTNKLIELNDLCICKGKLCWTLFVDVVCLDCDGGVLDSCLFAVLSALYYASLPVVHVPQQRTKVVDGGGGGDEIDQNIAEYGPTSAAAHDEDSTNFDALLSNVRVDFKNRKPIKMTHLLPMACTFILFDIAEGGGPFLGCDPTEEERNLFSNNDFSLVVASSSSSSSVDDVEKENEVLCGIYKYGGTASVDESTLDECVRLARRRRTHMLRLIREVSSTNSKGS